MIVIKILTIVLSLVLISNPLQAQPADSHSSSASQLFYPSGSGVGECLNIFSAETSELGNLYLGWKVGVENTCSSQQEVQVELQWLDSAGSVLDFDIDHGLLIEPHSSGFAHSTKRVENATIENFSSHQISASSVTPLPETVAGCLRVIGSKVRVFGSSLNSRNLSWRVDLENSCTVDLFTTVDVKPLSAEGFIPPQSIFGQYIKKDNFVPALSKVTVLHTLQHSSYIVRAAEYEVRLTENSLPDYSNLRVAMNNVPERQWVYDTATGLLTLPVVDDLGDYYLVTLGVHHFLGQLFFSLDLSGIEVIDYPPWGAVASFSSFDGTLEIPSLAADDGSLVMHDLVLELVHPNLFLFRIASYIEPGSFVKDGYSLDGDVCITIEAFDSKREAYYADGSGPPTVRWTAEVSNSCASDRNINLTYRLINGDGLTISPSFEGNVDRSIQEFLPANSTLLVSGDVTHNLTSGRSVTTGSLQQQIEVRY